MLRLILQQVIMLFICCAAYSKSELIDKPIFIKADLIEYNAHDEIIFTYGNINIMQEQYNITADKILYDVKNDILWAEGNIHITDDKNQVIYGDSAFFYDKLRSGIIRDFILKFRDNTILAAKLAKRVNQNKIVLQRTCFTPCHIPVKGSPIWQISALKTSIDYDKQIVTYRNVFFEVYKVPIFFMPYLSHPMPNAKAQSGILVPEIKNNALRLPLYWRAKPNIDFTLTPRVAPKDTILEFESRHRLSSGGYTINGSYGKTLYNIKDKYYGNTIKHAKLHRYHVSAKGNIAKGNNLYGLEYNRVSDKAYLKNYYEIHNSYLLSKLYWQHVKDYNYLAVEGLSFQGLRADNTKSNDPIIMPRIRSKQVLNLDYSLGSNIIVTNDTMVYHEQNGKQLTRSAVGFVLTRNIITDSGHVTNFNISSRGDVYLIKDFPNIKPKQQAFTRYIPEIQTIWRYPLISNYHSGANALVEPVVSITMGRKFRLSDNKFAIVDAKRYELNEYNLLLANHYSGIDCHDFGKRLSYGINSTLLTPNGTFSIFGGQLFHKDNMYRATSNAENVGKLNLTTENLSLFYRFKKNKKFASITDEFGGSVQGEKLQLTINLARLRHFNVLWFSPFYDDAHINNIKTIQQLYSGIEYQLTANWLIGGAVQANVSKHELQPLYKSMKVTYTTDCVSITAKVYDDYTFDNTRDIKKVRSKTLSVGLKVLNM